ncbi:MAG: hypothetical protein U0163_02870, partial [Gemmatimonadaceae bacterium]
NNQVLARLAEIDQRVNRVGQVVTEIATASGEQARGVELIDRTLDTMSRRTQEVAALADASERTAHALAGQSQMLKELVNQFRLPGPMLASILRSLPEARGPVATGPTPAMKKKALGGDPWDAPSMLERNSAVHDF